MANVMKYAQLKDENGQVLQIIPIGVDSSHVDVGDKTLDQVLSEQADLTDLAYEFVQSEVYKSGDYVVYNNGLYRLTADHAANVAWNNTSKVQVKLADQVSNLIKVSPTQPGGSSNKLWIDSDAEENIEVPTMEDFEEVVDDITDLKDDLEQAIEDFAVPTQEAVDSWLNSHPEATTTVQYGSLTSRHFSDELKNKTFKEYVTPEMYGAIGDGVNDDTLAIQSALNTDYDVYFSGKTYLITSSLVVTNKSAITNYRKVIQLDGNAVIKAGAEMKAIFDCSNVFEGFTIISGVLNCNSNAQYGIYLDGKVYGAYLRNIFIENATASSIYFSNTCHHCWVIGCKLYNSQTLAMGVFTEAVDTKVVNCEIYYTSTAIKSTANILLVTNCHLWSGGVANTAESTGILHDALYPMLMCSQVYFDSFTISINTLAHRPDVELSNCLFYIANTTYSTTCIGWNSTSTYADYHGRGCSFRIPSSGYEFIPIRKNGKSIYELNDNKMHVIPKDDAVSILEYIDTCNYANKGKFSICTLPDNSNTDTPNNGLVIYDINYYSTATIIVIANLISANGVTKYIKYKYNSAWSDWIESNETKFTSQYYNPSPIPATLDVNDDLASGMYRLTEESTNTPTNASCLLFRTRFSSTCAMDFAITSTNHTFARIKWTTWQAWKELSVEQ